MCKISELIEYLQKLPPEAEVNVLEIDSCGYQITYNWVPLSLEKYSDNCDYIDLSGNMFLEKDDPRRDHKSLDLGCT